MNVTMIGISNELFMSFQMIICNIFLIIPSKKSRLVNRIYLAVIEMTMEIFFVYLWFLRNDFQSNQQSAFQVVNVVNQLSQILYHVTSQIISLRIFLICDQSFENFQRNVKKLDGKIRGGWLEKTNLCYIFFIYSIPALALGLIFFIYSILAKDDEILKSLLLLLQMYQNHFDVFVMFSFNFWMSDVCRILNDHLKNIRIFSHQVIEHGRRIPDINLILSCYKELTELISLFNTIFGFNILLITTVTGSITLYLCSRCYIFLAVESSHFEFFDSLEDIFIAIFMLVSIYDHFYINTGLVKKGLALLHSLQLLF